MDRGSERDVPTESARGGGGSDADPAVAQAVARVRAAPADAKAWDTLEELATARQRPEVVAELQRELVRASKDREASRELARRATAFHEEWFGDDAPETARLLRSVLDADPEAEWAFDRLKMIFTVGEAWEELLGLYDHRLATTEDRVRRRELLTEAAHAAKDFAAEPGRAVEYFRQLSALEPDNDGAAAALERMLERLGRFDELVESWRLRLPVVTPERRRALRLSIARAALDQLGDPPLALAEAERLLAEFPGDHEVLALLEGLLARPRLAPEIRARVLAALLGYAESAGRVGELVAALRGALAVATPEEALTLHREAGARLDALGRSEEALEHLAAALLADPGATGVREQLRRVAERAQLHGPHVAALVAAAAAAEAVAVRRSLTAEAAAVARDRLADPAQAAELLQSLLDDTEGDAATRLVAARDLEVLLSSAGKTVERLAVLERIVELERSDAVRRVTLAELAGAAATLGKHDLALEAWRRRIALDPADAEARDAEIALLSELGRHAETVAALLRRAETHVLPLQRRADLVRIAGLQDRALGEPAAAIATWHQVLTDFGPAADVLAALDDLLSRAGRPAELLETLERVAADDRRPAVERACRIGDLLGGPLGREAEAVDAYARALDLDPGCVAARSALLALIEAGAGGGAAVTALRRAHERTGARQGLLELLPRALDIAADDDERARLRVEAGEIALELGDGEAALAHLGHALVITPDDVAIEARLAEAAAASGAWVATAAAFTLAADRASSPARAAGLRIAAGRLLADRAGDFAAATTAFAAAVAADSDREDARRQLARSATAAGQWAVALAAVVESARRQGALDDAPLIALAEAARNAGAWAALCGALEVVLAGTEALPSMLWARLASRAIGWYEQELHDTGGAMRVAERAIARVPDDRRLLEQIAQLQRGTRSPERIETLLRLDALAPDDLDALHEAATLALELGDRGRARDLLQRLYDKAATAWRRGRRGGHAQPAAVALWAVDNAVAILLDEGEREPAADLMLDAARLPVGDDDRRRFRHEAAGLLTELGRRKAALELVFALVAEDGDDLELVAELVALTDTEGSLAQRIDAKQRELELTDDAERKIELRIELSRLTGELERRGGRVEGLRANLVEQPGHAATLEALVAVLEERGRRRDLAELLAEQARIVEELGRSERAAELWGRAAVVFEQIRDAGAAIGAHARVAELAPTARSLDALAQLHAERQEPLDAARRLEQRLRLTTDPTEQVAVLSRLARAWLDAGRVDAAIEPLRQAFELAPRNGEVRRQLVQIYRDRGLHPQLAETLTTACAHVQEPQELLGLAREAADLWLHKLGRADRAVPLLERAAEVATEDRGLRSMLAEALGSCGEHARARALLEATITEFGRRRSPERARIHLQLAKIARDAGDAAAALDQLELATEIDRNDVVILQTSAELARETGQLERAERAYRALLLHARRREDPRDPGPGPATVLCELSYIAADRGDADKAGELVESALEAMRERDLEGPALERRLEERESWALLERVLQTRLANLVSPRRRAAVLGRLADLHEHRLDDPAPVLELRLRAIDEDPGHPDHHEAARASAARRDALAQYVERVEALLERARRAGDAHARCELLLRLGEAMEERGELERAAELYEQAAATGVREVDVWRASARVAQARGDRATQTELLQRLAALGEAEGDTRADALYRLAEVQLADTDTEAEGLDNLRSALEHAPRWPRAAAILARAVAAGATSPALLELDERVARASGNEDVLLAYLERRLQLPGAATEHAREAVDLARRHDPARALALLQRAVEVAECDDGGHARVGWAFVGLTELALEGEDLEAAARWFVQAVEVAPLERVLPLLRRLAEATTADPTTVVALYEAVRRRAPDLREVWGPLVELHRAAGDLDALERLLGEILPTLADAGERARMRISLAEALAVVPEREEDAIAVLQDALRERPDDEHAQGLLAERLERTGREAELIELLQGQMKLARDRGDAAGATRLALRLGERHERRDPAAALAVYREALGSSPDDPRLLNAVVRRLDAERDAVELAAIHERLATVSEPAEMVEHAFAAADLHAALGQVRAKVRVLEAAYRREPALAEVFARLRDAYAETGDHAGLAKMIEDAARTESEPRRRAAMLREAATLRREQLGDARGAIELLQRALDDQPSAVFEIELCRALLASGDGATAFARLDAALEGGGERTPAEEVELLRLRAELHEQSGDPDRALRDLEHAHELAPEAVGEGLERLLVARQKWSATMGDREGERATVMRLASVLEQHGRRDEAREALRSWTATERKDIEALHRLRDLEEEDGEWEALLRTCTLLVAIEIGDGQVDAAIRVARASDRLGRPAEAQRALEHALRKQPGHPEIRAELARVYEALGAFGELATLLAEDAAATTDEEVKVGLLKRVGELHLRLGRADEALAPLSEAFGLRPGDVDLACAVVDAHLVARELDQADAALERVTAELKNRRTPALARVQQRKSWLERARGNPVGQREWLEKAFATDRNLIEVAIELADLAEAFEDWELALKVLHRLSLHEGDSPMPRDVAYVRQGRIWLRRGDKRRAVLWGRKAQQEFPSSEIAAQFVAELGE